MAKTDVEPILGKGLQGKLSRRQFCNALFWGGMATTVGSSLAYLGFTVPQKEELDRQLSKSLPKPSAESLSTANQVIVFENNAKGSFNTDIVTQAHKVVDQQERFERAQSESYEKNGINAKGKIAMGAMVGGLVVSFFSRTPRLQGDYKPQKSNQNIPVVSEKSPKGGTSS